MAVATMKPSWQNAHRVKGMCTKKRRILRLQPIVYGPKSVIQIEAMVDGSREWKWRCGNAIFALTHKRTLIHMVNAV